VKGTTQLQIQTKVAHRFFQGTPIKHCMSPLGAPRVERCSDQLWQPPPGYYRFNSLQSPNGRELYAGSFYTSISDASVVASASLYILIHGLSDSWAATTCTGMMGIH
jgi:hypothetical protein